MRKLILTLSTVFVFVLSAVAQDRTITGKVTDEKGAPIEGASVTSTDGKRGTQTNKEGQYSISLPTSVKSLSFSFVNFEAQSRSIGSAAVLNVTLKSADSRLEEVVVVGYGIQQKRAFTGAASKVDVKEFANLMTPSIDKLLAGRAAGVQVNNQGGLVNTPASIRIRGYNSITQSNDPLIVIDGMPAISGNLSATTNSNALADINPADIESIDILKDGSATAIYGSRAAAGVILITTKKGTKGRTRVSYDGFVGFSNPMKKFDLLNANDFVVIANEKRRNANLTQFAGTNPSFPSSNTDWQGAVMIDNASIQNHTLSVNGGSDKTTFYLSLNYSNQKGVIVSNYSKSYRVRMNLEHEANKFIKFGNNITVARTEDSDQSNGQNSLGGAIASALRLLPNVSPYSATGWEGYNIGYNPNPLLSNAFIPNGPNGSGVEDNFQNVAYTIRKNKWYSDKYRIIDNLFMEISPAKGLKWRTQVGMDMLNDYAYQGTNLFHGDGFAKGGEYNASQNFLRLLLTTYLNYNWSRKGHTVNATAGYEAQKETYKWFSATGTDISDAFFISENVFTGTASTQTIGGSYDVRNVFASTFGRLNYDFKNKYFLQASIRRDGQSALAPNKKFGTFPGFSVGWRPSQEKFWQNSRTLSNLLTDMKIKASYAKVGNTLTGYPYLSTFSARNYGNLSGLGPSAIGNPDLQWETSSKYDIGFELGLLKNRFRFTFDWFLNNVDNLVLGVPQPLSAGIPGSIDLNGGQISQNIGRLQNKGVEISLGGTLVKCRDFSWEINANYSHVKNKIKELYSIGGIPTKEISNGAYNIIRVGESINVIYGYMSAGVNSGNGNPMFYKADGSLIQYNIDRTRGTIGTYYYALSKDDPNLGVATTLGTSDKAILGQGVPTYFGSFSNTFTYKNFSLDVMFRYSGGNKIMNYTRQEILFNQSFQNNGREILNRWTTPGQVTDVPKLYAGQAANINQTGNANSRFVEDGDYIKLQNVVLTYNMDSKKLESVTNGLIKTFRFFVQGQGLYTWSKYKGADPENINNLGVDAAVSPQIRTFSLGVNVGF